jgi:flagellar hook-associated protein 2
MNDILNTVNSNTTANVKMSYDSTNNKFVIETKQTGVTASIKSSETSGGLLSSLSLVAADVKGRDASITFNDGTNGDQVVTRSTNNISISGITFNLTKDNAGSVNIAVSSDPTQAVDLIKGFVAKYNEVLDKINTLTSEARNYDYVPLTDTQKEAMTDEQIKEWEAKAKTGLLANDSTLKSIVSKMRNALLQSVKGAGLTLSSIGIKSSSWSHKGKLYIDEDKLKNALSENPDQVISLFTNQSDVTYSVATTDSTKKEERFSESGLISRISDILQDNIRTTTINGKRGALLEKAGAVGDRSQYNNSLYHQISDYDDKIDKLNEELTSKENSYYSQFAQLETLINNMNSQSTWLSQQFS